jgi:hypothetical protein
MAPNLRFAVSSSSSRGLGLFFAIHVGQLHCIGLGYLDSGHTYRLKLSFLPFKVSPPSYPRMDVGMKGKSPQRRQGTGSWPLRYFQQPGITWTLAPKVPVQPSRAQVKYNSNLRSILNSVRVRGFDFGENKDLVPDLLLF